MKAQVISGFFLFCSVFGKECVWNQFITCSLGVPQFTSCPSPVCLSQPVTYVCDSGADSLEWLVQDTNDVRFDNGVLYSESSNDVGDTDSIGDGQFSTILTVDGSSLVSTITFTATLNISDYIVQCGPVGSAPVNCSIVIAGKINMITMPIIITCLQLFHLLQLFLLIISPSLGILLPSPGLQHQAVLVFLITVSMLLVLTTLSILLILV